MDFEVLKKYIGKNIDPQEKELWVSIYNSMIVHTRGLLPKALLEINRPNEPKDIIQYRLDTFQPITRDPIEKGLNSTTHLIKQSDYKVIISDLLKEFLKDKKFESPISVNKLSIYDLIFRSFLQMSVEDPNGMLLVMPINLNGGVPNDLLSNERPDFEIKYIESCKIKYFDREVLIYENGEVIIGDSKMKAKIYMLVDNMEFVTMMPTRIDNDGKIVYEPQLYYNHALGFAPFRILGGIETVRDVNIQGVGVKKYKLYDTYFTGFNSWANLSIIAISETVAVKQRISFPQVEMVTSQCTSCKGLKTVLTGDCLLNKCGHARGECREVNCSACNGRGMQVYSGPYGVIMKDPPRPTTGAIETNTDSVKFYNPDMQGVQVNKDWMYEMMDKMEKSISVYQSPSTTASGVSKEYDLEQKRDFISVIGDNLMNLLEFSLICLGGYLFDKQIPIVVKPSRYELRNKEDILLEIKNVGVINKDLVKGLLKEYVEKEYDEKERRILDFLINYDRYYLATYEDIAKIKAMQLFSLPAWDLHEQGFGILTRIFADESNLNKSDEQILELVNGKIIQTVAS